MSNIAYPPTRWCSDHLSRSVTARAFIARADAPFAMLDFAAQRYRLGGQLVSLSQAAIFARASAAWFFRSDGELQKSPENALRLLVDGAFLEPTRTNLIKDNTALNNTNTWGNWYNSDGRQATVGGTTGPDGAGSMTRATSAGLNKPIMLMCSAVNEPDLRGGTFGISAVVGKSTTAPYVLLIVKTGGDSLTGICFEAATGAVVNIFNGAGGLVSQATVESHGGFWRPSFLLDGWTVYSPTRVALFGSTSPSVETESGMDAAAPPVGQTLVAGWVQAEGGGVTSPIETNSSPVTRAADQMALVLPNGRWRIVVSFGDGVADQVFPAEAVSGGAWTVPTLNGRLVRRITVSVL